MARGIQLVELVDRLRAETRTSLDRSSGTNVLDQHKHLLNRVQEWLYDEYRWPFLEIYRDEVLKPGERYYSFDEDLPLENVTQVYTLWGDRWQDVDFGIAPEHYNQFLETEQTDPVLRWDAYEGDQYEVWPTPASNGTLRMYGKKVLPRMVQESDTCTLDGQLIVLFAAAELLASKGAQDAQLKLEAANQRLTRLQKNYSTSKRKPFVLGGGRPRRIPRPGIDYMPG